MENNTENTPNLDDKMNMLNDTRQELKKLQAQGKIKSIYFPYN